MCIYCMWLFAVYVKIVIIDGKVFKLRRRMW